MTSKNAYKTQHVSIDVDLVKACEDFAKSHCFSYRGQAANHLIMAGLRSYGIAAPPSGRPWSPKHERTDA